MESIRSQKNKLRKHLKTTSAAEWQGLKDLWQYLKAKHSALSKAEAEKKKKSKWKKTQDHFFKGPYRFTRTLFEQPNSGTLTVERDTL